MNAKQHLLPNDTHLGEDSISNDTKYGTQSYTSQKGLHSQNGISEIHSEKNHRSNSKIGVENFNIMEKLVKLYQDKKRQIARSRLELFEQKNEETLERNERLKINCHSLDSHSDDVYYFPWSYYHLIKQGRNNVNFHFETCVQKKLDIR